MRNPSRISGTHALALGAVFIGASACGVGCGGDEESGPSSSAACVSTREYFTTEIFGKAMQSCLGCHLPGGTAEDKGAKFKMFNTTWPDFVTANIESIKDYSKIEVADTPLLLLKPLGERDHGGGAVLKEDSQEFKTIQKFIQDLQAGRESTCNTDGQLGVELISNRQTARKAAIILAGVYPTEEELASVETEAGLDAYLYELTNPDNPRSVLFYDYLREIWNDSLLTQRGMDAGMVGQEYNNAPYLYDDSYPQYTAENRNWTSRSLTEEPMRYIEYVVRNKLPFTDVVAGNYLVANPFTAKTYGVPHDGAMNGEGFLDWRRVDFAPTQHRMTGNEGAVKTSQVPVAGILSTPSMLNRWETTPTNRARKRARIVMKNFLATDIFKFGTRPVDSTALTSVQNPTLNSAQCTVCHRALDPIAGGYRGFSEDQLLRFDSDSGWHDDLVPPGINGVDMPPSSYGSALAWMGTQVARDDRFPISVVQVMYKGIIGDDVNPFPTDKESPEYPDRVRAYNAQNDWVLKTAEEFKQSNFDLRKLIVAIVKSTYFRAYKGDPSKDALHEGLGQGRLLTPEMLGRKYRATVGQYYFNNEMASNDASKVRDGFLNNDLISDGSWRLLYGGIDSGDTTRRTETMTPIMLATSQYTSSIVACRAVSYDFTKPAAQRRLFKTVEMDTTPFKRADKDSPIVAVPDAEQKIKGTIVQLMFRLLGEAVDVNSDDVNKIYTLFVDVWKDLEETDHQNPNRGGQDLSNGRCVAENDYDQGVKFAPNETGQLVAQWVKLRERPDKAPYEAGMQIRRDENFTIRSWQAVLTYLLTDYRFTHE